MDVRPVELSNFDMARVHRAASQGPADLRAFLAALARAAAATASDSSGN